MSDAGASIDRTDAKSGRKKGNAQGNRLAVARHATLGVVFVAVMASLAFDSGIGTPSSFGVGEFFLICPLGGLEAMIADRSIVPVTVISMIVVAIFLLAFGRAWCAWGCPAPVIRRFFRRDAFGSAAEPLGTFHEGESCPGASGARAAVRHISRDSRTWVLASVLVATLIAGIPLFCLVCPIGLTFGTVGSLWHLVVDKQMTASVIVFPAALLVELVACRSWCANLCPIAGLMGVFGQFARLFRPRIDAHTCARYRDGARCGICVDACPERIDMHAPDAVTRLGECTRCGECAKQCPTASIMLKIMPDDPVVR